MDNLQEIQWLANNLYTGPATVEKIIFMKFYRILYFSTL